MKFVKKHKSFFFVFGIWILATAFNITKAVHVDDYFYIEWAKYLVTNPLHPMSWKQTVLPDWQYALHPPLVPYLYALVISIFGDSELLLHAVFSLFTLISVVFFFLLVKIVVKENALILTGLFILSPVFLPSQNLMLDIPSVSLALIFFYLIFSAGNKEFGKKFYLFAGLVAGIACLVKYSNLILIFFMAIDIILHKRWKLFYTLSIPIFILIVWSVFNYLNYGSIHLLTSSKMVWEVSAYYDKLFSWVITLGAVTPFSIIFLPSLIRKRGGLLFVAGCLALAIFYYFRFWQSINELPINAILRIYFLANGIFTCGLILGIVLNKLVLNSKDNFDTHERIKYFILFIWFVCTSLYLIISVPFMAVRHILPVMPAIILLFGSYLPKIKSPRLLYIGLLLTIILGFCLGLSDWFWANTARSQINEIKKIVSTYQSSLASNRSDIRIWNTGYFEWSYYGNKNGLILYENNSKLRNGDFLVMPAVYWLKTINAEDVPFLRQKEKIITKRNAFTFLSLISNYPVNLDGFYYLASRNSLPFLYSNAPLGEVTLYQYQVR